MFPEVTEGDCGDLYSSVAERAPYASARLIDLLARQSLSENSI